MLPALTLLLSFQRTGEVLSQAFARPIPPTALLLPALVHLLGLG